MKYLFGMILVAAMVMGCSEVGPVEVTGDEPLASVASKAPLYGTMDLTYNLGWPGPQAEIPDWVGSITIDDVEYGMIFYNIGTGKPFDEAFVGQTVKFGEIWMIFESPVEQDPDGRVLNTDVLMMGPDTGVTVIPSSTYRMNGVVEEAHGPFAQWEGRRVHMMGDIIWHDFGAPHFAPGVFRIN